MNVTSFPSSMPELVYIHEKTHLRSSFILLCIFLLLFVERQVFFVEFCGLLFRLLQRFQLSSLSS